MYHLEARVLWKVVSIHNLYHTKKEKKKKINQSFNKMMLYFVRGKKTLKVSFSNEPKETLSENL